MVYSNDLVILLLFYLHIKKTNICYLSFPDSNSGCMGDTNFYFRTRLCPIKKRSINIHREYNQDCYTALQVVHFILLTSFKFQLIIIIIYFIVTLKD